MLVVDDAESGVNEQWFFGELGKTDDPMCARTFDPRASADVRENPLFTGYFLGAPYSIENNSFRIIRRLHREFGGQPFRRFPVDPATAPARLVVNHPPFFSDGTDKARFRGPTRSHQGKGAPFTPIPQNC